MRLPRPIDPATQARVSTEGRRCPNPPSLQSPSVISASLFVRGLCGFSFISRDCCECDPASADFLEDLLCRGGHTNGLGSLLLAWRYASIAAIRSGTDLKTPRRMAFSVSSRNQRSAMFSHELDVGMKCRWNRGCLSSQATTLSWVWVP